MALRVSTSHVGCCCRVDLARRCSLLTFRQVKFVVEEFDLNNTKKTFEFVFWLYNSVALACEDNQNLRNPLGNVAKLYTDVEQMKLPALTTRKRKAKGDDDAGGGPPKRARNEGGVVESDIRADAANLEALKRAGYTIPKEVEGFESLLPVRVSLCETGND